jgi:hypothetical protein
MNSVGKVTGCTTADRGPIPDFLAHGSRSSFPGSKATGTWHDWPPSSSEIQNTWSLKSVNSKGFWRWYFAVGITGFLDSVRRPIFLKEHASETASVSILKLNGGEYLHSWVRYEELTSIAGPACSFKSLVRWTKTRNTVIPTLHQCSLYAFTKLFICTETALLLWLVTVRIPVLGWNTNRTEGGRSRVINFLCVDLVFRLSLLHQFYLDQGSSTFSDLGPHSAFRIDSWVARLYMRTINWNVIVIY